ncbi:hypothetical protein ACHHRT_10895 [Desulfurivibrio sp. D14AmB]|uniref:hypothetical protein n=1 Tax=Desulfurivibrio sp. D14AmB TaxID=3374370 RepID=UPI00376F3600
MIAHQCHADLADHLVGVCKIPGLQIICESFLEPGLSQKPNGCFPISLFNLRAAEFPCRLLAEALLEKMVENVSLLFSIGISDKKIPPDEILKHPDIVNSLADLFHQTKRQLVQQGEMDQGTPYLRRQNCKHLLQKVLRNGALQMGRKRITRKEVIDVISTEQLTHQHQPHDPAFGAGMQLPYQLGAHRHPHPFGVQLTGFTSAERQFPVADQIHAAISEQPLNRRGNRAARDKYEMELRRLLIDHCSKEFKTGGITFQKIDIIED